MRTLFQSAHLLFSYNVNYSVIACTVYSQSWLYAFLVFLFLFAMCVLLITAKQLPRIQWPCRWFLCHMSWSAINKNLIETEISIFVWAENSSLMLWHKPSYYNEWIYDCCVMIPPSKCNSLAHDYALVSLAFWIFKWTLLEMQFLSNTCICTFIM